MQDPSWSQAGPNRRKWSVEIQGSITIAITIRVLPAQPLACKLLILKTRRDVRVVEGARLEIALAVSDGVLQISITVAKPVT